MTASVRILWYPCPKCGERTLSVPGDETGKLRQCPACQWQGPKPPGRVRPSVTVYSERTA